MYEHKNDGTNTEYKKVNSTFKIILRLSLVLFILMGLCVSFFIYNNHSNNSIMDTVNQYEIDNQWNQIESIINENIIKSKSSGSIIVDSITTDIMKKYTDTNILRKDLRKPTEDSQLTQILYNNIDNRYLNNIKNENNSIFVMTKDHIIADTNLNTITGNNTVRSVKHEPYRYKNTILSKIAIENLISKSKKSDTNLIYIETLNSNQNITTMDMKTLHNLYASKGLDGLTNIRFLVPSYILKDKDILGINDSNKFGIEISNDKLIVVQRFNVVDIINSRNDYSHLADGYNDGFIDEIDKQLSMSQIVLRLVIILSVVFLLIGILSLNSFINNQKKIIENSYPRQLEEYEADLKIKK